MVYEIVQFPMIMSDCLGYLPNARFSIRAIFTARCYASAVLAMGLCLSVSATSRCSTKTAKRRITQTTQHDTPKTLVF